MSLPQSTDPLGGLDGQQAPERNSDPLPSAQSTLEALEHKGALARSLLAVWLKKARARARSLLALQLLFSLSAALLVDLLASAALAALEGPLPGRTLFISLACALPIAFALHLKFFARRSLTLAALGRDRVRLAALLVSRTPFASSAGSEILSSIELQEKPPRGASAALLSLLHQRAERTANSIDLRAALPGKVLRLSALTLAVAFACAIAFAARAPQLLHLGLSRLWLGEAAMPVPENDPIAGDLSITYLYPSYTNLPARVEEGTPGDLKAPKGTLVKLTARADRDLTQAYAVVDGTAIPLEVSGPGNRLLAGSLELTKAGTWRFRFADKKGRPVAEGPDRTIEIIADQPPTATLSDPSKSEVEVDPLGKLPLVWSALDDYGLGKVALIFQRPDEPETRVELAEPAPGAIARRLSGTYGWDMAPLQLREGDKVSFRIEALDRDAIDGPQKGSSALHTLKVFSAAEHHKEGLQRAQALWERLIVLLGDRLEEKPPPSKEAGGPGSNGLHANDWVAEHQARDARALQLVTELFSAGEQLAKDKLAPRALGRALKYVAAGMAPLVQRTIIARAPLSKSSLVPSAGSLRLLDRALALEIKEEEKDVLYLDDLLDQARIDDLQDVQRELKRSREELKRLAEKLKNAPDEATKKQILAEVERLRERVQELMQRMSAMAKGINDEHLNQEARESVEKEQDLMSQLSDVQKKMQAGDIDAALSEIDKLSKSLEQLEGDLSKSAEQRGGEKYAEEGKMLRAAAEKMSALKSREEELEKRTGRLRKDLRTSAQKRFEQKGGKQLAQKLADKVAQAKKQIAQIDPHVADNLGLEETLDAAQERVSDLERALQTGDYQEALEQANRAERAASMLQTRLNLEDQLRQLGQPVEVRKSLEAAALSEQPLHEVAQALREAMPDEETQLSPEQKAELQSQEGEQRDIEKGMQGVREQMGEVGKKVPIFGPQHEQLLQEAQGAMQQAGSKLGQREPRGAEGSEGEALDKLGKFEDAMKDLAKQGGGKSGAGMPMPWGEPQGEGPDGDEGGNGGDDEGNGDDQSKEHVDIPDAESSRGPQEFRKKLLDAMKQPAPEKFRDKVRGYYEELVK